MKFFFEFNFKITYKSKKQDIKSNNLIKRINNLLKNINNKRYQYQNQIILKKKYLNKRIKNVVDLISIFLDKKEILITKLAFMIYDLYKISVNNEKLLKKSLF